MSLQDEPKDQSGNRQGFRGHLYIHVCSMAYGVNVEKIRRASASLHGGSSMAQVSNPRLGKGGHELGHGLSDTGATVFLQKLLHGVYQFKIWNCCLSLLYPTNDPMDDISMTSPEIES
ncbi:hypothetical protein TNCV_4542761 [Trichonephila clavipes]|nr:hypothetical protein TNCV_4542761 [Trichonephila clavipes]